MKQQEAGGLRSRATDPSQYESGNMNWATEGDYEAPSRKFIREYIEPIWQSLRPHRVLDVGCGTGWISRMAFQHGTQSYLGIEPSAANVEIAAKGYPNAKFLRSTLEGFDTPDRFNLISAILSTEHVDDLDAGLQKLSRLLEPQGYLLIVAGDFDTFQLPRFDFQLTVEHVSANEVVVRTLRPNEPSITDIVRTPKAYEEAAGRSGLTLLQQTPMFATDQYVAARPRNALYRQRPIMQLMLFQRSAAPAECH